MIGSIMQGLEDAIVEVHRHELKGDDDLRTPSLKQKYTRTRESQKINEKAVHALVRIKQKFVGAEWGGKQLTIREQVGRLIREAISHQNICQSWPGWCPYW